MLLAPVSKLVQLQTTIPLVGGGVKSRKADDMMNRCGMLLPMKILLQYT